MQKGRWSRWRALGAGEKRATLAAALLLPAIGVALRVVNARRLMPASGGTICRESSRELARAVTRASAHGICAGNCLSRSILLARLLRARGLASEIRFGARTSTGSFEAHAWVVHDGVALNDAGDYVELRQKERAG